MNTKTASQLIGSLAVITLTACGKGKTAVDDGLARDLAASSGSPAATGLELAPRAGNSQVVVSAIEAGPEAALRLARRVRRSQSRRRIRLRRKRRGTRLLRRRKSQCRRHRLSQLRRRAPAPAPPVRRANGPRIPHRCHQRQDRARSGEQQRGTYSTEAEIFRRMPWIRP